MAEQTVLLGISKYHVIDDVIQEYDSRSMQATHITINYQIIQFITSMSVILSNMGHTEKRMTSSRGIHNCAELADDGVCALK